MMLCENNIRLGLYEKAMPNELNLVEKLQEAKKLGFDFVEMSVDETEIKLSRLAENSKDIALLKTHMSQLDIKYETMCLSAHRKYPLGSENEKIRNQSIDIGKKAITLANSLGIRIIQLAGYDEYYFESNAKTERNFYNGLCQLTDYASSYGVMLGFETMETPFMNTIAKAKKYVDIIGSPYLGVYPDIGNMTNSGTDIACDIKSGGGKIFAAHLKETKPNVFREVQMGSGHVDFSRAISLLISEGVRRFTIEMWANDGEWEQKIIDAKSFIEGKL